MRIAGVVLVSILATGCARYYWHRQGAVDADFQRESRACVSEALVRYDIVREDVYRACMRARRWTRVHGWQSCPEGNARAIQCPAPGEVRFRGPEDEEDFARILAEPSATPR